jgi:hypothetical protein
VTRTAQFVVNLKKCGCVLKHRCTCTGTAPRTGKRFSAKLLQGANLVHHFPQQLQMSSNVYLLPCDIMHVCLVHNAIINHRAGALYQGIVKLLKSIIKTVTLTFSFQSNCYM